MHQISFSAGAPPWTLLRSSRRSPRLPSRLGGRHSRPYSAPLGAYGASIAAFCHFFFRSLSTDGICTAEYLRQLYERIQQTLKIQTLMSHLVVFNNVFLITDITWHHPIESCADWLRCSAITGNGKVYNDRNYSYSTQQRAINPQAILPALETSFLTR